VALKTGAEGYYIAILPQRKLGIALKIADGASRASQCAIAALLVRLGVLDPANPATRQYLDAPVHNYAGLETGQIRAADTLR
jgi:L-asparaginase II